MEIMEEVIIDGVETMDQEDWEDLLQSYRRFSIQTLRAINRGEITVTSEQRDEIERAARGVWFFNEKLN